MSKLQARSTAKASGSSISARSRWSRGAYSWRRSLAPARARWSVCSKLADSIRSLFLFQSALQRVLVLARIVNDLRHLGFGNFIGEHAAHADAALVDVQHDAGRFLAILAEELFEHVHDELHGSVVVIQHQHLVHRRLLRLRLADRKSVVTGNRV